jgi:uncharacterized protein (DUF305 family)
MTRTLTRRAALAGAALLAGMVLSACGANDNGSPNGAMPHTGGSPSAAPTSIAAAAFADADVTFSQQMIPHHQQAVAMAALASTRDTDPEVKKLAGQIKAAQDPEIATMTGWLTMWGKPMPMASTDHGMDMGGGTAMPGMMSGADMTKLAAATGKDFDKQFLTMMIAHHEGALTMAQNEAAAGKNPDAIALAQQITTTQQAEITAMKAILARL